MAMVRAQEAMVQAARQDPADLGWYALGLEPKPFHREWQRLCSAHDRFILWAPVDHGKSSQLTVIRTLWELGLNSNLRVAIISRTEDKAKKWLGQIKSSIAHNDRLHDIFPELRPETREGYPHTWAEREIIVRRSERFTQKDYSVEVAGILGDITGARFDLILLDDVLDFLNTRTQGEREKVYEWVLATLIGRLTPGARMWAVGTAQHEEDAYHRLEKESGFATARFRALIDGVPIWPERWPVERIERFRQTVGEIEHGRQMLNIPFGEATGFFPITAVRECQRLCDDPPEWWWSRPPAMPWIFAGVDLGASRRVGSALSSIFLVGIDREGLRHVVHVRSGLWVGLDLFRQLLDVERVFHPSEWAVESNAAQLHVAEMLADPAMQLAVGARPEECYRMPVYALYTTERRDDPRWGVRAMAPEMQALRWRIPSGQAEIEQWIAEMKRYSPAEHPGDRLMASHFAHARVEGVGEPIIKVASSVVVRR